MATPKKVSFSPHVPTESPKSKAATSSAPEEDELLERPTILRIKRRRDELPSDVVVLEAELPVRKKKTMNELNEALQGLKVAQDLHQQFKEHLAKAQSSNAAISTATTAEDTTTSGKPAPVWSAPSKTLENQMRKVFRLLGSDDSSSEEGRRVATLVNDAQSGRVQKRQLMMAASVKTYEGERKKRMADTQRQLAEQRSYHLRRVDQKVARLPGEFEDPEDEMVRILELVSETTTKSQDAPTTAAPAKRPAFPGGLQLPIVHSAKKLQAMQAQKEAEAAKEAEDYVTFFYVLDDDSPIAELGEFDAVQVPLSQFRQELLNDFVLEGEYSDDEDALEDSSDSQNRSEDWEYGSDKEDDDRNGFNSSGETDEEEEGELDEIMDPDGDYYHRNYTQRGYDFEIDPNEGAGSDDDE